MVRVNFSKARDRTLTKVDFSDKVELGFGTLCKDSDYKI
ncbi:hypothetical protein LEP1GSC060_3766 [Leptospira weilii serovar Ranarum str. ICFT]|uniref:Uncharacterized protein n=1 Tax=Leptospira weilii serovar Ranarum str. ICFT TaxID=1218598 RepID=N1WHX9_9LEPT|nr:hypothetical protein LEP1GSC060_3766 [Leptospira weilii serovar Ranarum str. ICFT]